MAINTWNKRLVIGMLAVVCLLVVTLGMHFVTGGKALEMEVEEAARTNNVIQSYLKGRITKIEQSDGPWRVEIAEDGSRRGSFSLLVAGEETNADFKVQWIQTSTGRVEIVALFLQTPLKQDRLLWERSH